MEARTFYMCELYLHNYFALHYKAHFHDTFSLSNHKIRKSFKTYFDDSSIECITFKHFSLRQEDIVRSFEIVRVKLDSAFSPFLYLKQGPRNSGGGIVSMGFVVI